MSTEVLEVTFADILDRVSSISCSLRTVRQRSDPVVEALAASLDAAHILCAALAHSDGGAASLADLENTLAAVRAISLAVRFALVDSRRATDGALPGTRPTPPNANLP